MTGGVYHSSGGAEKDAIKFNFQKIAPQTYKILLAGLKKGEYGILPPGGGAVGGGASGQTVQGGSMQAGKLYTFGIIEKTVQRFATTQSGEDVNCDGLLLPSQPTVCVKFE